MEIITEIDRRLHQCRIRQGMFHDPAGLPALAHARQYRQGIHMLRERVLGIGIGEQRAPGYPIFRPETIAYMPGDCLVMVGQVFEEPDNSGNARVIPTGFVTDEEKRAIMMHSCLLVNPSKYESLSLIVLEALNDRVPVLVNGRCEVLKEHCIRSKGAVKCYTDEKSFCDALDIILSDPEVRAYMAGQGYDYYLRNYTWEKIMPRLYKAIGIVSGTAE